MEGMDVLNAATQGIVSVVDVMKIAAVVAVCAFGWTFYSSLPPVMHPI